MKRFWNHTFLQYLASYALVLFLPLIVLGCLMHFYFTNYYIEEALSENLDVPQQIQAAVDLQVTQMDNFAYQIGLNSNFSASQLTQSPMSHTSITNFFSSFKAYNDFVSNVYYYPGGENDIYYSMGGTNDSEVLFNAIYQYTGITSADIQQIANNYGSTWIGDTNVDLLFGNNTSYVTYIRPVYGSSVTHELPYLIFQIHPKAFEQVVNSVSNNSNVLKIITTSSGEIVFSSLSNQQETSLQSLLADYEGNTKETDSASWRLANLDKQEVYISRIESSTGLTYITLMPTDIMLESVYNFQHTFSTFYIIFVTFGFILVLIVSQFSYKPMKRLAESIKINDFEAGPGNDIIELAEHAIEHLSLSSLEYRQEHLLLNLLRKAPTDIDKNELAAARLQLEGPYFRAAILHVKGSENLSYEAAFIPNASDWLFLLQKAFVSDPPCYIIEYMERNCFILIFSQNDPDLESCSAFLQRGSETLRQQDLQVSIYAGNAYSSLELLNQSFHEAKTAFINRNLKQETNVYFYGIHSEDNSVFQQIYPTADLDVLCNAIEQENPILVEFMSMELLRHIENISGDSFLIRCICYEAINHIFQTMDKKYPGWMKRACTDIVNNLSVSSVEDLKLILQTLCSQVILDIKAKPSRPQKLSMKDATAYVDAHFCDPDFSVKSLAADYKMSVSNFSHQFKTYTGKTVSDYINHKKIQYAKELFRDTGDSVAEVASKVGYFHTSSFIRKYKQEEGITPGEYLEQLREKQTISEKTE